jgi:hypothetical protein
VSKQKGNDAAFIAAFDPEGIANYLYGIANYLGGFCNRLACSRILC